MTSLVVERVTALGDIASAHGVETHVVITFGKNVSTTWSPLTVGVMRVVPESRSIAALVPAVVHVDTEVRGVLITDMLIVEDDTISIVSGIAPTSLVWTEGSKRGIWPWHNLSFLPTGRRLQMQEEAPRLIAEHS
jgi:hypothetical protein